MKADEVRFAEAVASLTARLDAWNVEDAAEKAESFMRDMLHHGWRARALPTGSGFDAPPGTPAPDLADVRAKLRADAEQILARENAHRNPTEEAS